MGVSTDAILAFGVDLGETDPCGEQSLDEYLAGLAGHEDPYNEIKVPELHLPRDEWDVWKTTPAGLAFDELTTNWFQTQRALEEAAPVTIIRHCSYDYSMFILALKDKTIRASRGYLEKVDLPALLVADDRIAEAATFCREHNLPAFEEPRWLLASMWG